MEDVGIFHGRLVYFKAVWNILCPFGIFDDYLVYFYSFGILYGIFDDYLVYFYSFGILYQDKSGNPDSHMLLTQKKSTEGV
jgi:hypothetical protein